jgi:hypothetical protein
MQERVRVAESKAAVNSGRYHVPEPDWEGDTEPPPPEAQAYQRVSWMADTEQEALDLDYLIKAYKTMSNERRVLLMGVAREFRETP